MSKLISTVQFSAMANRHMVETSGITACMIQIEPEFRRSIRRRKPADVNCWLCRKRGGLLRPKKGVVTTAMLHQGKTHLLFPARQRGGWSTPCHLHFALSHSAVKRGQSYVSVSCGHCMRFAFD